MRKLLSIIVLLWSLSCFAALPPGVVGKKIPDYANLALPPGTYMFLISDPGGNYFNITLAQLQAMGTNSGTLIVTNVSFQYLTNLYAYITNLFSTNITSQNIITTNVTIEVPGGFTNLNLTVNSLMRTDSNDAEASVPNASGVLTNNGTGGIGFTLSIQLTEIDAQNFYPTNLFTGDTNYDLLGTDGDGKLKLAIPVAGTNLFLLSGNNITFTTNGDGSVTIAASGNVNIQTITNTTLYTTNAYMTTVYISTNYTTNFNFVTGKGNVLIVTNVSINGTLTNSGVAASSIVSTDAKQVETNAVIAARLSFSGNSLDLASGIVGAGTYRSVTVDTYGRTTAGSNPTTFSGYGISDSAANLFSALTTYDFSSATNLTYIYKTNAVTTGVLTFGQAYRTNINADITLGNYTLGANGSSGYESLVILVTNSDTSVHKITHPSGVFTGGAAAVSWITNGYWNMIVVDHFATLYTNAQVKN